MTTTSQDEGITALYDELAVTALNQDELEPWVSLTPPPGKLPKSTLDLGSVFFDLALWFESASPHRLTPPMKPEESAALKEGIRLYGLVDGVVYINQRGIVIDGYNRMKTILELLQEGVMPEPPEVRFVQFKSDQDEYAFVLLMNVTRRMLDDDQKEEVLKNLLRSGHDGTDNWLSRLCGLSPDKVSDVRAMLENLPIAEGGIEFQDTRRSEAGKSYKQRKREPESEKRRARAGLPTSGKKPKTKGKPGNMKPSSAQDANVTEVKPAKPELEQDKITLDAVPDVEVGVEMPSVDDSEDDAELRLLVDSWWKAFQFLPVLSRELAAMVKSKPDGNEEPPTKGKTDGMTRLLKPLVGREIHGYLILYKSMSAGVAAFMLCPVAWCQAKGIDKDALINRAGTV